MSLVVSIGNVTPDEHAELRRADRLDLDDPRLDIRTRCDSGHMRGAGCRREVPGRDPAGWLTTPDPFGRRSRFRDDVVTLHLCPACVEAMGASSTIYEDWKAAPAPAVIPGQEALPVEGA